MPSPASQALPARRYQPADLLRSYNAIITAKGLTAQRMSSTAFDAMSAFGTWCESRDIDPEEWIHARHRVLGWKHVVPANKLISDKFVERFRAYDSRVSLGQLVNDRDARAVVPNTAKWDDDPTSLNEVMKRQLRIDPESCVFNVAFTGGWNPRSDLCVKCPMIDQCKERLPPDVRARRERVGR